MRLKRDDPGEGNHWRQSRARLTCEQLSQAAGNARTVSDERLLARQSWLPVGSRRRVRREWSAGFGSVHRRAESVTNIQKVDSAELRYQTGNFSLFQMQQQVLQF